MKTITSIYNAIILSLEKLQYMETALNVYAIKETWKALVVAPPIVFVVNSVLNAKI